ncbi:hypothetical protein LTR36_001517 [Oleoguttula mirabilis]|uniref:Uncharacterized protein n=1 Tax=Oleoguttula mirabilis TaxID=1507867 RepID=A0AAV9JP36_9PEZI|nr:hypothetical protein LTR36_001517 [Oleoguttula mirabilis]
MDEMGNTPACGTKARPVTPAEDRLTADTTAAASTKTNSDTVCHLLLAAELRNRIYELAVSDQTFIRMPDARQPALTRTCRQIRNESLPLYYECNTFRIYDEHKRRNSRPDAPVRFGPSNLRIQEMKHIQIEMCGHGSVYNLKIGRCVKEYEFTMVLGDSVAAYDKMKLRRRCRVNDRELAHGKSTINSLLEQGATAFGERELEGLIMAVAKSYVSKILGIIGVAGLHHWLLGWWASSRAGFEARCATCDEGHLA